MDKKLLSLNLIEEEPETYETKGKFSPRPSTGRASKSSSKSSGKSSKSTKSIIKSTSTGSSKSSTKKSSTTRPKSSKPSANYTASNYQSSSRFNSEQSLQSLESFWTWDGNTRNHVNIAPAKSDQFTLDLADSKHAFDVGELTKFGPEYRTEPYFELSGEYSYGYAENFRGLQTDNKKNFKPQLKRLQREGGKSIQLYEDWRMMQYKLNIVIKRFLVNHGVNSSVLPPCVTYDMWRDVEFGGLD